jgi:hypothetical protein
MRLALLVSLAFAIVAGVSADEHCGDDLLEPDAQFKERFESLNVRRPLSYNNQPSLFADRSRRLPYVSLRRDLVLVTVPQPEPCHQLSKRSGETVLSPHWPIRHRRLDLLRRCLVWSRQGCPPSVQREL